MFGQLANIYIKVVRLLRGIHWFARGDGQGTNTALKVTHGCRLVGKLVAPWSNMLVCYCRSFHAGPVTLTGFIKPHLSTSNALSALRVNELNCSRMALLALWLHLIKKT